MYNYKLGWTNVARPRALCPRCVRWPDSRNRPPGSDAPIVSRIELLLLARPAQLLQPLELLWIQDAFEHLVVIVFERDDFPLENITKIWPHCRENRRQILKIRVMACEVAALL